jgi:hypothetical protein
MVRAFVDGLLGVLNCRLSGVSRCLRWEGPAGPMGVLRGYVNYVAGFERITGMSSDTQDIDTRLGGLSVHDLRDWKA